MKVWSRGAPGVAQQREAVDAPLLDATQPRLLRRAEAREKAAVVGHAVARVVHVELGVHRERVVLVGDGRVDPVAHQSRAAQVRGAQREAVHGRQVAGMQVRGVAVGQVGGGELLGLRLVEGRERRAAGVADQEHLLVAGRVQVLHAGAQVLDRALHQQHRVVAHVARVQPHAADAALGQRADQVVAHEVAGRMHHDGGDSFRTGRRAEGAVDAWAQHLQARLALHGRAGLHIDDGELQLRHLANPSLHAARPCARSTRRGLRGRAAHAPPSRPAARSAWSARREGRWDRRSRSIR